MNPNNPKIRKEQEHENSGHAPCVAVPGFVLRDCEFLLSPKPTTVI